MLGHGHRCPNNIRLLKGVRADELGPHLPGDGHHRDGIHVGVHQGSHQVGGARAGRRNTHTHAPRCHGVAFRGVASSLLVAHEDVVKL